MSTRLRTQSTSQQKGLLSHLMILLAIISVAYGVKMNQKDFVMYGLLGAGAFLFFKVCFILSSKGTPCPLCRANHLASSRSSKHKDAYKILFLSYSSTAAVTAFFRGCVRCMHCGVTFSLSRKRK